MKMTNDEVKLVRNYNRQLNVNAMKKKVLNSAITLGFYERGLNEDNPIQDAFEALLKFNDNDVNAAMSYKSKKRLQLNPDELASVFVSNETHRFQLLDYETGVLYNNCKLNSLKLQDKIGNLDNIKEEGGTSEDSPGL
jgi:hypothetical protein